MHADKGKEFIESLDPTGVDVLVLAGDICGWRLERLTAMFSSFSAKYPNIVHVPGNHEFYGSTPTNVWNNIKTVASQFPNIHTLNNETVIINGQRFIGGTGWFPHYAHNDKFKQYMNDFRIIKDFEPWVYQQHQYLEVWLNEELLENDIVVTHHLPSVQCVAPQYKLSPLTPFFLSELDDLILEKKPKIWLSGHTHTQFDFNIGPTRLVCNPLGYPGEQQEQAAFQPKLLIEV